MTAGLSHAQFAQNSQGDLWGSNQGDFIMLRWLGQTGVTQYIVYRGTSISGPWTELFRDAEIEFGGSRVDVTSDAKLMDLCYRVEAIDGSAQVIRAYQPVCVPRFVG
jgi:hypothetical protein